MALTVNDAKNLMQLLKEPVRILNQDNKVKKFKKSKFAQWRQTAFFWAIKSCFFSIRTPVTKKVQILDVNLPELLQNVSHVSNYEEMYLKRVVLKWTPYISSNMSGQTTVLLCDFRSSLMKNIIKGGYTFATAQPVDDLLISPGYLVNLKDPNLGKIFKFIVFSSKLDLRDDSFYGNLELALEIQLGGKKSVPQVQENCITLVSSKNFTTVAEQAPGPAPQLLENISLEDIIESFQDQELKVAESKPKVESIEGMTALMAANKILNRLDGVQTESKDDLHVGSSSLELPKCKLSEFPGLHTLGQSSASRHSISDLNDYKMRNKSTSFNAVKLNPDLFNSLDKGKGMIGKSKSDSE